MKRLIPLLAICLVAASAVHAQPGGGGRRGGGGQGGGGQGGGGRSSPSSGSSSVLPPEDKPADQIDIIGVVKEIDPATDRITIDCDANDTLNLPAGARPFIASKHALLNDVKIGEKVRFRLESQQIATLRPF